ncbi:MAG: MBL fold metallo-hydrolase [Chloroflexi bacterium]|nr:MBL fold metallo-hydrolase [Chloroflexota bacterium]
MKRDRVSDDVSVFTSTLYAQVTASVVLTPEGAVLIDTLPFPDETREIIDYLKTEGARGVVRYVVNTHRHGDHTHGNYLFPNADIIGHRLCRETLMKWGQESLEQAKEATPQLAEVELRVPNISFEREMSIYLGGTTLELLYLPGHTIDGVGVHIRSEKILFAGDAMMPLPYFFWGDMGQLKDSMNRIRTMELEHIVQGHGDVLLRGEIDETIDQHLSYLDSIYDKVKKRVEMGVSERELQKLTPEKSGGSPIAMDGMAKQLHYANLVKLYRGFKEEDEKAKHAAASKASATPKDTAKKGSPSRSRKKLAERS